MKLRDLFKQLFQSNVEKNQEGILHTIELEQKQLEQVHAVHTYDKNTEDIPQQTENKDNIDISNNPLLSQGIDGFTVDAYNTYTSAAGDAEENVADVDTDDVYDPYYGKKKKKVKKVYTFTPRQSKENKKAIQQTAKKLANKKISVKIEKKAQIIRQLSILLDSGMDLRSSLAILEEQEVHNRNIWFFVHTVFTKIEAGDSLSDALQASPIPFNESEIAMVKAGEATGRQAATLAQMASLMEKKVKIKKKIVSAMVYPATILVVSSVVVLLLTTVVVPKFEKVIADQIGADKMPALTDMIVKCSKFIADHLTEIFWIFACIFIFIVLAKTVTSIKRAVHGYLLKLPMLGTCINTWSIVLFSRTFGDLLQCGCSVLESLRMAKESVGNYHMRNNLSLTINDVKQGLSLTDSLRRREVFPAMAEGLIKVGEEAGKLGEMMGVISDNYEEQLDEMISRLTSMLEPLLVIFLSFFVGTIVIGLFLPIVSLIQNISV